MKVHLLYMDRDFDFSAPLPPNQQELIQDLELSPILEALASTDKFLLDISTRVLLTILNDETAIRYRQEILEDCRAAPGLARAIYGLATEALKDKRGIWGYNFQSPSSLLSGAVRQLEADVLHLRALRKLVDEQAGSWRSTGMKALFRSLQEQLGDDYFETVAFHLKQLRLRKGELISAELAPDNSGTGFILHSIESSKQGWKERLRYHTRTAYSFSLPPRDEAGEQALANLANRGLNLVANAAAQSADHIAGYFATLRAELGFYIACLNLYEVLDRKSVQLCRPDPCNWQPFTFSASGLCNPSLALRTDSSIVGTDIDASGESTVIITGANSGGKSTFLRSTGLALLMMQSGMLVAATSFRASVCTGLFTHFPRKEDPTMTSGHLDEELARLSTIIDQIQPHCLVLFNESFASTNEKEGSEIGYQVIRALNEADTSVFFVSHHFELADRLHRDYADSTLFLRAERLPDGQRTYKLAVADPLPTSFGKDLYYRLGEWGASDREPGNGPAT